MDQVQLAGDMNQVQSAEGMDQEQTVGGRGLVQTVEDRDLVQTVGGMDQEQTVGDKDLVHLGESMAPAPTLEIPPVGLEEPGELGEDRDPALPAVGKDQTRRMAAID